MTTLPLTQQVPQTLLSKLVKHAKLILIAFKRKEKSILGWLHRGVPVAVSMTADVEHDRPPTQDRLEVIIVCDLFHD